MKKKYISLITAALSVLAIAVYAVLGILFIIRVANGNEFIPQVEKSFWLYEVIQRIGKAGFNVFFSIIGIILSAILIAYRSALVYFYLKVFKGDGAFYRERRSEIIFFSVLAGIVSIVAGWFFVNGNIIPPEFKFVTLPLFIIYILLCILPIVELVLNAVLKVSKPKEEVKDVPTKEGIVKELDKLADETAENAVKEIKEEIKEQSGTEKEEEVKMGEEEQEKTEPTAENKSSGEEKKARVKIIKIRRKTPK